MLYDDGIVHWLSAALDDMAGRSEKQGSVRLGLAPIWPRNGGCLTQVAKSARPIYHAGVAGLLAR
eukprot:4305381-Pyramimonas_sp.AAC.1